MDTLLGFLTGGLTDAPWWVILIVFVFATQFTNLCVTLYLHRAMAHRGLDLHPVVSLPMRAWVWLTTGMITREWVAVHRKHHAFCEREGDPHSPQIFGIKKVLWHGVALYRTEALCEETVEKYGHGCPNDWFERYLFRFSWIGPTITLFVDVALFGAIGLTFWALQMIWIPMGAAGVINGLGHYVGYRNFATEDTSTNLVPWGLALGGEELHNNHHAFPSSAKFALKPWEFDIGWAAIQLMSALGLAEVRRVAPALTREADLEIDDETLRAVFVHRFSVMADYCREVIRPAVAEEAARARGTLGRMRGQARKLLTGNQRFFDERKQERLSQVLEESQVLATVYEYRLRLASLWDRSTTDPEALLASLRQWCREAEETGIAALRDFARSMGQYRLATT